MVRTEKPQLSVEDIQGELPQKTEKDIYLTVGNAKHTLRVKKYKLEQPEQRVVRSPSPALPELMSSSSSSIASILLSLISWLARHFSGDTPDIRCLRSVLDLKTSVDGVNSSML